jgi:hypothetical protein
MLEAARVAVGGDGLAFDQLHREVRLTVRARAAVVQARDVRMLERREDAALEMEAAQDLVGIHAALHELQRHPLVELAVGAFREVDGAHAAAAELAPRCDTDRRCDRPWRSIPRPRDPVAATPPAPRRSA